MKLTKLASSLTFFSLTIGGIAINASAANLPSGTYTLALAHSNKCMDVPYLSTADSVQLWQWGCNNSAAQQFDINPTDSGYYKVININSGKAVDIRYSSGSNGAEVQQYSWNNSWAQHFIFQSNGDGYIIRNRSSGKCVEQMNGVDYDSGVLVQMTCTGSAQQTFSLTPTAGVTQTVANGRYLVKAAHTGKCLDVPWGSTSNSVQLQQYTCNSSTAQQFDVSYVGNGLYEIFNVNSGKCLDVRYSGTSNGTAVQQYSCNQNNAQRFYMTGLGDGKFHIKSALTGNKLVEIGGGSTVDGGTTQIWSDAALLHQKWTLESVVYSANMADGAYNLKPVHSGKCIDVPNSSLNPGQSVQQYACNGSSAQSFDVRHQANGYYRITNTNSGLALSVREYKDGTDVSIEQQEDYGSDNQLFQFVAYGSGYVIRPKSSYKCFDISGNSTSNGAGLEQDTCYYGNNQVYQFQLLSSDPSYNAGSAVNNYPIVLLHGFTGWGRDEMFGLKYWGGGWSGNKDLQQYLGSQGHNAVTLAIGPLSSNWDRAIEAYYQLKGGCVDYGAAHSAQHNHARYGRCYTALLPNWDATNKIHIIAHSQGGQTARVLLKLLRDGKAGEGSEPLYAGGKNWIKSISTFSTPHDGTTLTDFFNPLDVTEKIFTSATRLAGLASGENVVYDLKLDQWALTRNAGEGWSSYFNRVKADSAWANTLDNGLYDLSPEGAPYIYGGSTTYSDVYYFSFQNKSTASYWFDPWGHQYPIMSTLTPFIPQSIFLGQNGNNAWWENDGVVNTISMKFPTGASAQSFDGYPVAGTWQYMPLMTGWDHLDMTGLFTLKNINPVYLKQAQVLKSLY